MNDETIPEWDRPDPPSTASIDARLCELLLKHIRGDHDWPRAVMRFAADVREHDEIPELLSAVCRHALNTAIGCHGAPVTIARLESDLEMLWVAAAKASGS